MSSATIAPFRSATLYQPTIGGAWPTTRPDQSTAGNTAGLTLWSLRQQVGNVSQVVFLFGGTLRENIA